jgi:hypothetical protein
MDGSDLSSVHFKALKVVSSRLPAILEVEMSSDDEYSLQCSEIIEKYSIQMRNHMVQNLLDEVQYVQPLSRSHFHAVLSKTYSKS